METRGWVTSDWDNEQTQGPPRRVYELTQNGREILHGRMRELGDTRDQIDHLLDTYGRESKDADKA
jgi:DNA-binding PadR family transcriptional regulator